MTTFNCVEIWKDIDGYEGHYEVSNIGRVRSVTRVIKYRDGRNKIINGKVLSSASGKYYNGVSLCRGGLKCKHQVHRLVATAFLDKVEGKNIVDHIDNNKHNNHVSNLQRCTTSENALFCRRRDGYIESEKQIASRIRQGKLNGLTVKQIAGGEIIKIRESQAEAARSLGLHQANIHKCCRGERNTAGGYGRSY